MKGNLALTNYPQVNHNSFHFKVGNGYPHAEFGNTGSSDAVALWTNWTGFNKLLAQSIFLFSDSAYKFNSTSIPSPLEKILSLKPYQYDFKSITTDEYSPENSEEQMIPQYGFYSQEVEATLSEINITMDAKGVKLLDYSQLIPLVVAGIQDQNKQIEQLQAMTALMMATNPNFNTTPHVGQPETNRLIEGNPNPFTSSTQLRYNLLNETTDAVIKIYDMKDSMKKEIVLSTIPGNGQTLLRSSDLGVKGQYVYALFINSSIVDAKTIVYQ
jgi:Chaperone of endosialidase